MNTQRPHPIFRSKTCLRDCEEEVERLEAQAEIPAYDPRDDFACLSLGDNLSIIDIGCGSGVMSRHLARQSPTSQVLGIDCSDLMIQAARARLANANLNNLRFAYGDILGAELPGERFDIAVSRYLIEHLPDPEQALLNIRQLLKIEGLAYLIDNDGLLVNLVTDDPEYEALLQTLRDKRFINFHIGRRLSLLLHKCGFEILDWSVKSYPFTGEVLRVELENFKKRFTLSHGRLTECFESSATATRFTKLFFREVQKPQNIFFCQKYMVLAKSPGPP